MSGAPWPAKVRLFEAKTLPGEGLFIVVIGRLQAVTDDSSTTLLEHFQF